MYCLMVILCGQGLLRINCLFLTHEAMVRRFRVHTMYPVYLSDIGRLTIEVIQQYVRPIQASKSESLLRKHSPKTDKFCNVYAFIMNGSDDALDICQKLCILLLYTIIFAESPVSHPLKCVQ